MVRRTIARLAALIVAGSASATSDVLQFTGVAGLPSRPEPSGWAMIILGFGAIGTALRSTRLASE